MGLFDQLYYSLIYGGSIVQTVIGLIVILSVFSAIRRRFTPNRLVMRAYRIENEPLVNAADLNGNELSEPLLQQVRGEPVYAALVGRPEGFINFIREAMGIPKRFEFALTHRQTVLRTGSLTAHFLQSSQLEGLNSVSISQHRLHPLIVLIQFFVTSLIINVFFVMLFRQGGGIGLNVLIAIGFIVYWFICKITSIEFAEAGHAEVAFTIYPAMLERLVGRSGLDMPLPDANRLVQLFHMLKERSDAAASQIAAPVIRPAAAKPATRAAKTTKDCAACGTSNAAADAFCANCGGKL